MFFPEIEHVVYINLDERTDRRAEVEDQLSPFGSRVERFSAIKNSWGAIGCSQSHIAVLKLAKERNWGNVLVIEDDFIWKNRPSSESILSELLEKPYDVILLGGAYVKYIPKLHRCIEAQTTTAYLVNSSYYDTMISNFEEGLSHLLEEKDYGKYALDQWWKQLQRKDRWFIIIPGLATQRPSFSDIEGHFVNYEDAFV